jgi:hypothetical protein
MTKQVNATYTTLDGRLQLSAECNGVKGVMSFLTEEEPPF